MSPIAVSRPPREEYAPFFEKYVSRVEEPSILEAMASQIGEVRAALAGVRGEAERFRYAPGKWSLREIVGHAIDTERIMGYRACCVARGETASLPGFDENAYVLHATFDACPCPSSWTSFSTCARGTSPSSAISTPGPGRAWGQPTRTPSRCGPSRT